jgi:hypothetical protein
MRPTIASSIRAAELQNKSPIAKETSKASQNPTVTFGVGTKPPIDDDKNNKTKTLEAEDDDTNNKTLKTEVNVNGPWTLKAGLQTVLLGETSKYKNSSLQVPATSPDSEDDDDVHHFGRDYEDDDYGHQFDPNYEDDAYFGATSYYGNFGCAGEDDYDSDGDCTPVNHMLNANWTKEDEEEAFGRGDWSEEDKARVTAAICGKHLQHVAQEPIMLYEPAKASVTEPKKIANTGRKQKQKQKKKNASASAAAVLQ